MVSMVETPTASSARAALIVVPTTIESVVPLIDFLSNINAGQNKRIGETKPIFEPTTMYAPTLNDLFPHCLAL